MMIWKWLLVQRILDGYPLREHLIAFNETHILDDEDAGVVGLKEKENLFIKKSEVVLTLKILFLELRRCCQWSSCIV
jgi:hypothetical protein